MSVQLKLTLYLRKETANVISIVQALGKQSEMRPKVMK